MRTDPLGTGPVLEDEDTLHRHRGWVIQRPPRIPRPDPTHPVVVTAAVHTAHHLLDNGYPPLFDIPTIREVWRAGHHTLASNLYELVTREVVD